MRLYLPVILGTSRPKRRSIHPARLVASVGTRFDDVDTELLDPQDFHLPFDGNDEENKDPRLTEITRRADGFFVVTPEYNHSFPGTLKRLLDSELRNYIHKPVAFAGVSSGPWGGIRAIEALVSTVREMGLVATFTDVQFPKVQDLFDDEGGLREPSHEKRVVRAWEELVWMARCLRWGRETLGGRYHGGQTPPG